MTDSLQPTSGSLEAVVIRACTVHRQCGLDCPNRVRQDLGQIASFQQEHRIPTRLERLKAWIANNFWE